MTAILPALVDAYLILEQPRQRLGHWSHALANLDSPNAPPLASVTAYYDPTCDQALLGLRYDELALGTEKLGFLVEVALLAEIGLVQPHELSEGERKRFVTERLARCTVHVAGKRTAAQALVGLVRKLKEAKLSPKAMLDHHGANGRLPPIKIVEVQVARSTRDDLRDVRETRERDIASLAALASAADPSEPTTVDPDPQAPLIGKGTRNDLPNMADGAGPEPPAPPRPDYTRADRVEPPPVSRNIVARAGSPRLADSSSTMRKVDTAKVDTAKVDTARVDTARADTARVDTARADTARVAAQPRARAVPPPPPVPTPHATFDTEPYLPTASRPSAPDMIYARYLRSGRWVPIRIGQLSLKGAALLAGALPRVQDHVDVALSFANLRAIVRGTVGKVSTVTEAAASGASTFSVAFELDDASRRQLTALLTAARAAQVTIKPPPPRSTRRFPVEWPVHLGTMRGAVRADVLDISLGGMFIRPSAPLVLDATLNFSAVLEDGGAPIAGRARVVRQITEAEAKTCGLTAGYGVRLVDMGDTDHERWRNFLARVEKRSERRVLIGASPVRLAELQSGLAAAGYAVTGGTDPGALVQLASGDSRPVDAAVVDAGWLGAGASAQWVETLFSARGVPCLTLHGDARRARSAIDKLLQIT